MTRKVNRSGRRVILNNDVLVLVVFSVGKGEHITLCKVALISQIQTELANLRANAGSHTMGSLPVHVIGRRGIIDTKL